MRVRRMVDLTLPLSGETQVYPGDQPVEVVLGGIDPEGFHSSHVSFGTHSGTHCDAPMHFVAGGASLDAVDLTLFAGPAVLIDVRHRGDREHISLADVAPSLDSLGPGVIAVLHTGWTRHYGTPRFFDHPVLTPDACQAIVDRGVRTLGVDAMSLDETVVDGSPGAGWPCHRIVLGAGGVLLENLAYLDRIDFARPYLTAFPLNLTAVDGSPVRAVAHDLAV